ncbi:unknown [Prevotella sp. CAG:1185]|nr:unknown [Prevotella sp. CAG:1185]
MKYGIKYAIFNHYILLALPCAWQICQRYSSHSFLVEHAFFSIMLATAISSLFTFLAPCGHTATQRMHDMQAFLSTFAGLSVLIAPTGHLEAHRPQLVHWAVGRGTKPTLPAFLYGLLPGIAGVARSFRLSLAAIFSANLSSAV